MKKLFLIRHAKAEEGGASKNDFFRNISSQGEGGALKKSVKLLQLIPSVDLIISSDANRALQTAKIFAKTFNYNPETIITEHFLYNHYEPSELLHLITGLSDTVNSVMIFGHNPNICYAANELCNQTIYSFPTSCVACIEFENKSWQDVTLMAGKLIYLLND